MVKPRPVSHGHGFLTPRDHASAQEIFIKAAGWGHFPITKANAHAPPEDTPKLHSDSFLIENQPHYTNPPRLSDSITGMKRITLSGVLSLAKLEEVEGMLYVLQHFGSSWGGNSRDAAYFATNPIEKVRAEPFPLPNVVFHTTTNRDLKKTEENVVFHTTTNRDLKKTEENVVFYARLALCSGRMRVFMA
ncbi:hypothetical protein [Paenibacillus sp. MBLB4367]|uniref:hypothetical protein n=1 Tax=Paenibacillus sp. MBLB4367 TaxID=3384767 RepID=UPI00390839BC